MESIIITASKSLTICDRYPDKNINKCTLSIGNDGFFNYISYLFFDISSVPCNAFACYAELVLFRVDNYYNTQNKPLCIYGLNESFNSNTSFNYYPEINQSLKKCFYPPYSNAFIRIPITSFIRSWIKNCSLNNNIMLFGKSKNFLVNFASSLCVKKYLVPFIKINYISHWNRKSTLRKIHVSGTIAAKSKYNSVVNIGILRHHSKITNNYYVAEEFDNSKSNTPLHVNKTYGIAIVPQKKLGDIETISFYGSYKE